MTVLFADLAGSTSLGERLDPEELDAVMSAFLSAMETEITAQGGVVEKYAGDAILAVFGAPAVHEDDPARALRAALGMRRQLEKLNRRSSQPPLQMRIGVNTGEVLAATRVRPDRAMVSGDAVNVAARLEQVAEPGQILVGHRTAQSVRGARLSPIGPLVVKGKALPLRAFALEDLDDVEERGLPGIQAPMVGRELEMEWLSMSFNRARAERRPHLVTIFGDAGVGKSRLVREFLSSVDSTESLPVILRGRCLPYGDGVTYWPLGEILKGVAGIFDTDTSEVAVHKITQLGETVFESVAADSARIATAALAFTLGLGVGGDHTDLDDMPARQVQIEMRSAWRTFLTGLAAQSPLVIVVEDIHWADTALLDFLEDVAERTVGPVLILCPARPELAARRPTWGGGRRNWSTVSLQPLGPAHAERLVTELLAIDGLARATRQHIVDRAEGNPLFIEETLRHLIDAHHLLRVDGRWVVAGDALHVAIPDTVQAILAARLDLLDGREKAVIQAASVVGRVFWSGAVSRVSGIDESDVADALRELERRELIEDRITSSMAGEREYIFRHVLVRDVAYGSLPRAGRAEAHARTARWVGGLSGGRLAEMSELLAHHWLSAYEAARVDPNGDGRRGEYRRQAWSSALDAASDAHRRFALGAARGLADRAIDLAEGWEERAEALALGGQVSFDYLNGDDARREWKLAIDILCDAPVPQPERVAELCGRLVELASRWVGLAIETHEEADADRYFQIGIAAAGDGDSVARAQLLMARAFWAHSYPESTSLSAGLLSEIAIAEEAATMAERLGLYRLASAALDAVQSNHLHCGRFTEALETSQRRFAILERTADPWEQADTYAMATWLFGEVGDLAEADRIATEGYERLRSVNPHGALHSVAWRAVARFHLGDWDGALGDQASYAEFLGEQSDHPPIGVMRVWLVAAIVHEARGDGEAAARLLATVDGPGRASRSSSLAPYHAWLLCEQQDPVGALSRLDLAAANHVHGDTAVAILAARCDAVGDAGRWTEVPSLVRAVREGGFDPVVKGLAPRAMRLEARAAIARGDLGAGVSGLEKSASMFASYGARWDQALTLTDLVEAHAGAGQHGPSMQVASVVRPILEAFGAARHLQRVVDVAQQRSTLS